MKIFEYLPLMVRERMGDGSTRKIDGASFSIMVSQEAQDILRPIFQKYHQSPLWFLESMISLQSEPPWAIVCLSDEYEIAGHLATTRKPDSGINFVPYSKAPESMTNNFVPKVGVIALYSKEGLENVSANSPLFLLLWEALKDCDPNPWWLLVLGPLYRDLLDKITLGDREKWLSTRQL